LSPLCIVGAEALGRWVVRICKSASMWLGTKRARISIRGNEPILVEVNLVHRLLVLVVLIPYFLFNTGFIFEVTKWEYTPREVPTSIALSSYRLDGAYYNWQEGAGMEWLSKVIDNRSKVYADEYGKLILEDRLYGRVEGFPGDVQATPYDTYIYLRSWNVERNEILVRIGQRAQVRPEHINLKDAPELHRLVNSKGLLYNNGGAKILAP